MTNENDAFVADLRKMIDENRNKESAAQVRDWAELDTWSVEEGLLLISGINPKGTDVVWKGGGLGGAYIRNAWPLGEYITFLSIPAPTIKLGNLEEPPDGGMMATGGEVDDDEQKSRKLSMLRDLEKTLTRALRLWVAGQHADKRYPPGHFIEWAKSKGMTVNRDLERAMAEQSQPVATELPDDRRIRFVKMGKSGMTDAEIAQEESKAGCKISRARVQELRKKGEAILADQAQKATSLAGQLMPGGVAGKKTKKQT